MEPTVGVLALQGDFAEHLSVLTRLGVPALDVRRRDQLERVAALIMPGGESTTISRLLLQFGLFEPLRERALAGMPVWGTCAGAILLAREVRTLDRPSLGLMDMVVDRNAFGRQIDSFEADVEIEGIGGGPVRAVFIRAPIFTDVGPQARVLGRLADGTVVAVRQGNLLATSFHPELTDDTRVHERFLELAGVRPARGETAVARAGR